MEFVFFIMYLYRKKGDCGKSFSSCLHGFEAFWYTQELTFTFGVSHGSVSWESWIIKCNGLDCVYVGEQCCSSLLSSWGYKGPTVVENYVDLWMLILQVRNMVDRKWSMTINFLEWSEKINGWSSRRYSSFGITWLCLQEEIFKIFIFYFTTRR